MAEFWLPWQSKEKSSSQKLLEVLMHHSLLGCIMFYIGHINSHSQVSNPGPSYVNKGPYIRAPVLFNLLNLLQR